MSNLLNRKGIATMIADMLKADTSVLYGTSKLVQKIESNPTLFRKASVDIEKPYGIFIWCPENPTEQIRSQNSDETFLINFRVEGLASDTETAVINLDLIDQRIKVLINNQMHEGLNFSSFYSDSKAQVVDVERTEAIAEVIFENERLISECSGAIKVLVNRWK